MEFRLTIQKLNDFSFFFSGEGAMDGPGPGGRGMEDKGLTSVVQRMGKIFRVSNFAKYKRPKQLSNQQI